MTKTWTSIAWWPAIVCLGSHDNRSTDTHASEEEARWVIRTLEREGLGGEGKIFPLRVAVEETTV